MKKLIVLVVVLIVVFLIGYNFVNSQQDVKEPMPVDTRADETSEMVDDPALVGQEAAMNAVREAVASETGVEVEMVDITSVEQRQWPDACLGITDEDQMCAQVVTPGYELNAEAQGNTYTYHTNADATSVRKVE